MHQGGEYTPLPESYIRLRSTSLARSSIDLLDGGSPTGGITVRKRDHGGTGCTWFIGGIV